MSWQEYLDPIIRDYPDCRLALIASLEYGDIYAKFENGSEISQDELVSICDTMKKDPYDFQQNGIYLAGEKYLCAQVDPTVIGRKGSTTLAICATKQCIVAAAADDLRIRTAVEDLARFLKESGY